jgi:hypothetical protein
MTEDARSPSEHEELSLNEAATHLLEECRTVLPGIQALFGFQLVAVFNARFSESLSRSEQRLHLVAICVVAIAVALVMAPAVLHRQTDPRGVSQRFLNVSSRLLMWSMLPLAFGICLDLYLIARMILDVRGLAMAVAVAMYGVFALAWIVLPRSRALQRRLGLPPRSKPDWKA